MIISALVCYVFTQCYISLIYPTKHFKSMILDNSDNLYTDTIQLFSRYT